MTKGVARSFRHLRINLMWVTVVAATLGCAQAPAPPLSAELRQRLSPLQVIGSAVPTEVVIIPIPTGNAKGAVNGAGEAVAGAVQGCLDVDPTGLCVAAALFFSPYLAVGGAVYGIAAVEPESRVDSARTSIERVMARQSFHADLARRVQAVGREQAAHIALLPFSARAPQSGYRAEAGKMILELAMFTIRLGRKPAVNPELSLIMEARVRVLRGGDGGELYHAAFPYRSGQSRRFSEWAVDGARPLRAELRRGYLAISEAIVQTLLLPPARTRSNAPDLGALIPLSP